MKDGYQHLLDNIEEQEQIVHELSEEAHDCWRANGEENDRVEQELNEAENHLQYLRACLSDYE